MKFTSPILHADKPLDNKIRKVPFLRRNLLCSAMCGQIKTSYFLQFGPGYNCKRHLRSRQNTKTKY